MKLASGFSSDADYPRGWSFWIQAREESLLPWPLWVTQMTFFYDAARRLIYVIGGEGSVEIFRQHDPDHYEQAQRITTALGARTGFFLPNSGRLYVAVPHRGSQAAKVLVYTIEGS